MVAAKTRNYTVGYGYATSIDVGIEEVPASLQGPSRHRLNMDLNLKVPAIPFIARA